MLSNAEVLAKFGNWLSPGDISQILPRLLRVPEVWDQIHQPEFIELILNEHIEQNLLPLCLVRIQNQLTASDGDPFTSMEEMDSQLEQLVGEIETLPTSQRGFQHVAILTEYLLKFLASDYEQILERILNDPSLWGSALACAWSEIGEMSILPTTLLHSDRDEEVLLVVNALMANLEVADASQTLLAISGGALPHNLFPLISSRESLLVQYVIKLASSQELTFTGTHSGQTLDSMLLNAYIARQNQEYETASGILHNAQETSDRFNACISDQCAEIAGTLGDGELELEARENANRYESTAQRRASLAFLLNKMGQTAQAHDVLDPDNLSIEEKIVFGILNAQEDRSNQHFIDAAESLGAQFLQDFSWTGILIDELVRIGESAIAVKVARIRDEAIGMDPNNKAEFARFLLEVGDPISATDHAYIAYALSPQSIEAREILAKALQESGSYAEALAHWNVLSETDTTAILRVARCALEAGFVDLAIHTANSLLTNDSFVVDAQMIIGEAYRLNGEVERAKEHFEGITQKIPQNAKAWIALAECQEALGDREAAGHTLGTAIQMNPSSSQLLHARSLWLEGEGRLSEALEAIEGANGLDPKGFDIQIAYGDLLRKLGHYEKSLSVLKNAVSQIPYHWKGLNSYAQVLAELGKHNAALGVISKLPASAAPEAHFTAGEITIRAAQQTQDVELAKKGIEHLDFARLEGIENSRLEHWRGVAYETTEEFEKALNAYQTSLKNLPSEEYELILDTKVGLGRSALAIGQTALATSLLEDTQRRNQRSISLLVALSDAYLQSQKKGKAFTAAENALDLDPTDQRAIRQITEVAAKTDNWALAMQAMKKVVDLKPLDPSSWITYAESASFAKNIPEARNALAQALRYARTDPGTLAEVARVMLDLDLPHSASRCLKRAIKNTPDKVEYLRALARTAELVGDKASAQRAWSRCVELDPTDSTTLEKAAEAHWQLGLRSGALDMWHRAHRIEPDRPALSFTLASAHSARGDSEIGLDILKKVVNKNPDNIDIALESARLAIDFGEAFFAADLLEGILRRAPTRNDLLLSLAETYIALNQNQKASEILKSVIIEPTPPDYWHAISAISAHRDGDLKRALTFYNAGYARDEISTRDGILLSKAALELGRWDDALELVDRKISVHDSWQLDLARANTRIRMQEVKQILSMANVVAHTPTSHCSEQEQDPSIEQLIDSAVKKLAPKNVVEVAKIRKALIAHSLNNALWNDALLTLQSKPVPEVLEALAMASLHSGKHQETVETVALRDDLGIESEWLDIIAGISQHSQGQFSASHKSFQRAENNPTLRPVTKYLSSKSLIALNDRKPAIDHINAALHDWPTESAWHFELGNLYVLDGNLDLALPYLQEASELSPSNPVYRTTLAKALKDSGHLSQAYEYYQIAVKENPTNGNLWLEAGQLALGLGEFDEAEQYFEQARELLPSEVKAFTGAAKTALAIGNIKSAMKRARTAMHLAPEEPDVLITLGEILAQRGKIEKALESFNLAIPKLKDPLPLLIARARLLVQANRSSKAMEEMRALTELFPENEEIWASYAEICDEINNLSEGIEAANTASKLAPNNPGYHLLLARLSRKSGQLDRALDELSKLEQKDPTNAKVLTELGMLYEDRRQYTEALDAFQRSIACNGSSSITYLRAGIVLKHLKIYPQAGEMLSKAVELSPKDPEALHQLAAVRALELVHGGIQKMVLTT